MLLAFPEGGGRSRIEFGLSGQGEEAAYFVRDDGAGFDPAYANNLFKPFQRLPGARGTPGSGIGLAIVKRAVERLGGTITVESEPCTGTRFTVELEEARHDG